MVKHFGKVLSGQPHLLNADIITVEADFAQGLHSFSIVGLPDKAVAEAKDRVGAALKNSNLPSPKHSNRKVVVSLAPASVKKEGALFDTPIALSFLLAAGEIVFDASDKLFVGELGLDGSARSVDGILPIVKTAQEKGIKEIYVPLENIDEALLIQHIDVYGYTTLSELVSHLNQKPKEDSEVQHGTILKKGLRAKREAYETITPPHLFDDIQGQEHAKRGLIIAAAGRHNIAFYGPPGTGKTMLAHALQAIIPELNDSELLEVQSIHSVAGTRRKSTDRRPPIRNPHHTASYVSIVGGGANPKPGEVTMAHHGVLFLDEFPEFQTQVINALRQPLEDGVVSISRARGSVTFPSRFICVAALNPCPCGFSGSSRCTCSPQSIQRYRNKISGPVVDRIDMWIEVQPVAQELLLSKPRHGTEETARAIRQVSTARDAQRIRYTQSSISHNSELGARKIHDVITLNDTQKKILADAGKRLRLSPRGIHRIMRLARTIADIEGLEQISEAHLLEALQYRPRFET